MAHQPQDGLPLFDNGVVPLRADEVTEQAAIFLTFGGLAVCLACHHGAAGAKSPTIGFMDAGTRWAERLDRHFSKDSELGWVEGAIW
jgi:hypothetical protein